MPPNLRTDRLKVKNYTSGWNLLSAGEGAGARLALDAPAGVAERARGTVFGNVLHAVAQPGSTLPPHESRSTVLKKKNDFTRKYYFFSSC